MKSYEINLSGAEGREEIQKRIAGGLDLPEDYGNNLDALYDVLTSLPLPCRISFSGSGTVTQPSDAAYVSTIKKMCGDAAKEVPGLEFLWDGEAPVKNTVESGQAGDEPKKVKMGETDPSRALFTGNALSADRIMWTACI